MGNVNILNQHFDLLERIVESLNLRLKPENIFNCDESMMQMDGMSGKVVVTRRTKHAYLTTKGSWEHITINACVSASGQMLPPHIIFKEAFPGGPYGRDSPHQALYSKSPNGYMDSELFFLFIDRHFIPHTLHIPGPKLLILDGYGSTLDLKMSNLSGQ